MAKPVKKKTSAKGEKDSSYLTKRVLERAISKGTRHISDEAMARRGFIVTAKNGWVVKVYRDGREERISEIPKAKNVKHIALD